MKRRGLCDATFVTTGGEPQQRTTAAVMTTLLEASFLKDTIVIWSYFYQSRAGIFTHSQRTKQIKHRIPTTKVTTKIQTIFTRNS